MSHRNMKNNHVSLKPIMLTMYGVAKILKMVSIFLVAYNFEKWSANIADDFESNQFIFVRAACGPLNVL